MHDQSAKNPSAQVVYEEIVGTSSANMLKLEVN
jgi:hypothetical protein